jgi:hypothetical protein
MRYWTFLIAANRQFDYRPAICPDFVKSGKRDFFRRNLDSRSYASEGMIHTARIDDTELGPMELFYATEFVRDADHPGAFVYDDSGRRFYFTHGIVARPDRRGEALDERTAEQLIAAQRSAVQSQLKKFLASEQEPAVMVSHAVSLDARISSQGGADRPPDAAPQGRAGLPGVGLRPRRDLRDVSMVVLASILALSLSANSYFIYADYFDDRMFSAKRTADLRRLHDVQVQALKKKYRDADAQRQAALADLAKAREEVERVTTENAALKKTAENMQQKKPGED